MKRASVYVCIVMIAGLLFSCDLMVTGKTVTYYGNGNIGGSVPVDNTDYAKGVLVTVLGNTGTLVKTGNTFEGWNTAANGSGTAYAAAATFSMGASAVSLYAQWAPIPTHPVTYDGIGSTGGSAPVDSNERAATYRRTEYLSYFYPNLQRGFVEARLLMTSFQWLVKGRPDLRDFSGYDLLRVDVRSDVGPIEINLALEDNILEPPVMRTYRVPADEWVTIELDLQEAARVRELDLARIANFWLMARPAVRATVRIDNN